MYMHVCVCVCVCVYTHTYVYYPSVTKGLKHSPGTRSAKEAFAVVHHHLPLIDPQQRP